MVARGSDVMAKPLWVPMGPEERKGHVDSLLRHLERVDELTERKKAEAKKLQTEIDAEMGEVMRLRRVLRDDGQQMTLADATIENDPTKRDATNALAEVGAIVEGPKAEEFDENNPPSACPKCGKGVKPLMAGLTCEDSADGGVCDWIGRPAGKTLSGEPLPVEGETEAPAGETTATDGEAVEDEEDVRPRCKNPSCKVVLTAIAVVKKLGVCEDCEAIGYTEGADDVDGNVAAADYCEECQTSDECPHDVSAEEAAAAEEAGAGA